AGGCMLVRVSALEAAGGIERIRDRVIDDCALAALLKPEGPIWLGLTDNAHSLRRYDHLRDIWDMVARTAFVQLDHSLIALGGTVLSMALLYITPPLATLWGLGTGDLLAAGAGLGAWLLMAGAVRPTLKLYGQSPVRGLLLPGAAALYTLMTADSARRHLLGRGGAWKGRSYQAPETLASNDDG
ncbi:MAG: squalene-phytoene synthase, partial [Rhodospirillales bacterium]|nr:squalene-phytoene synthase [Rhodospirillales bacterium]